jgi:hypothetical protein
MKIYKVVDLVMLCFAKHNEYIKPSISLSIECDGTTVWLRRSPSELVETITSAHAIDVWVNTGRLVEIGGVGMASTSNNQYVKFTYFRDTESPRTVTAARMLDGNKMYIDWCVNHMNKSTIAFQWNNYIPEWNGDAFNKAKARNIARSRLLQKRYCVELKTEERKLEQMIEWLLANTSNHVQHIIRNAIAERNHPRAGQVTFNVVN